jgi:hypothetical protein
MSFIGIYFLFCITTTILGIFTLIAPTLSDVKFEQPLNPVSQHPVLSHLIFICVFLLIAPLVLYSVIYTPASTRFKSSLHKSLTQLPQ